MTALEPIYKFPQAAAPILWLAGLGKDHPRYVCPSCRVEREHVQQQGERSGELFVICLECGQGSRVQKAAAAPTEFRPDGWPLCPCCGEDELWSPLIWDGQGERPPLQSYIAAGLRCYRCHWMTDAAAARD